MAKVSLVRISFFKLRDVFWAQKIKIVPKTKKQKPIGSTTELIKTLKLKAKLKKTPIKRKNKYTE